MSEEIKDTSQNLLANPFVAMDFGEKIGRAMGEMSQRIAHVEERLDKFEVKLEVLDAKTDKLVYALHRLDERTKLLQSQLWLIGGATLAAVLAGLILQILK